MSKRKKKHQDTDAELEAPQIYLPQQSGWLQPDGSFVPDPQFQPSHLENIAAEVARILERDREEGAPERPETVKARAFVAAYATCGNITMAARMAGVSRRTHSFRWMKNAKYRAAFERAEDQATDLLEAEARRRAHEGTVKPVFQGGAMVGVIREYSDTLLMFLLRGKRPAYASSEVKHRHTGPKGDEPVQLEITDKRLQKLSEDELSQLTALVSRLESADAAGEDPARAE